MERQEHGKDFCQETGGRGQAEGHTEVTRAVCGKTFTTFLGWDRSLYCTT